MSSDIWNSFWDIDTSGQPESEGDAVGKSTSDMQDLSTFTETETGGLEAPWDIVANNDFAAIETGTASSGSSTELTDSSKSWDTDEFVVAPEDGGRPTIGHMIEIVGGTGEGQTRMIVSNDSDTVTIDSNGPDWSPEPDETSKYRIRPTWKIKDGEDYPRLGWEDLRIEISDINELQAMDNDLTEDYVLVNNIDASDTETWNDGAGFEPIGDTSDEFFGSFDGDFYTITGLHAIRPDIIDQGLFGIAGEFGGDSALIENVVAVDFNIKCASRGGAIVGELMGATIRNCGVVGGNVEGTDEDGIGEIGGVAGGGASGGLIEYCHSIDTIIQGVSWSVGGVAGGLWDTELGGSFWGESSIRNCYSRSIISGDFGVGGITGIGGDGSTVENCYSASEVSGDSSVGGIVGHPAGCSVENCFWDTDVGPETSDGGTGKTTAEMQDIDTYTDTDTDGLDNPWDMVEITSHTNEVWKIDDGNDYPRLGWEEIEENGGNGDPLPPILKRALSVFSARNFHSNVFGRSVFRR